jgi:hypothetical protein
MTRGGAWFVGTLVLVLGGCATIQAGTTRSTEQMLAAAGFHVELADTPEGAARLQALPPRKLAIERRGSEVWYVYPDPDVCGCSYVGTEAQHQEYQRLVLNKRIADEQLGVATQGRWGGWSPWGWGVGGL